LFLVFGNRVLTDKNTVQHVHLEVTFFETKLATFLRAIMKLYRIYAVSVKLHPHYPRKFSVKIIVPFQRYCSFCSGVFYLVVQFTAFISVTHSPAGIGSVLRMKIANHIVKQTLYNPDRHMSYVQRTAYLILTKSNKH